MVEFPDTVVCEFFYPGRTLGFQRTINSLIVREVRSRGGKVSKTVITKTRFRTRRHRRGEPLPTGITFFRSSGQEPELETLP